MEYSDYDKGYVSADIEIQSIIWKDGLRKAISTVKDDLCDWWEYRKTLDLPEGVPECLMDFVDRHEPKWLVKLFESEL